ncbi:hypothetical protein [Halalkalicoccus sp. NIPERK01]|uniref:hypothetical protein n=1 Tax=Halalkalicoccus sp. NIPERK01 TaxID=3053469 RepID=UPI00256F16D3|nr:hypothetical protein [Halalkalicoccus sp. NIPERK01]MDL5360563.1 hypothetical protein [Halalkalicoccus sp. NIPERK01]
MAIGFDLPSLSSARLLYEDPKRAMKETLIRPYQGLWYTITSRYPIGTNVFERDWDLLVVLDACRVDAMREVADEYEYITEVESMLSVGSNSHEWLAQTFSEKWSHEIAKTTYVTANFHSGFVFRDQKLPPDRIDVPFYWTDWNVVDGDGFYEIVDVWDTHRDDTFGVTPPHAVTGHAIDRGRSNEDSRIIAHYMQPHGPYIANAVKNGEEPSEIETGAWRSLRDGDATRAEIWELYLDNLRVVLDQIDVLLENVDAETVAITSDHGEAFGEFGAYGHPEGFPHPVVKKVPWIETTAEDLETRKPDLEAQSDTDVDIEERLEALGYV